MNQLNFVREEKLNNMPDHSFNVMNSKDPDFMRQMSEMRKKKQSEPLIESKPSNRDEIQERTRLQMDEMQNQIDSF